MKEGKRMRTPEALKGVRKRKQILNFIIEYTQQHGYAPSYKDIAKNVGLRSTSTVKSHIEKMKSQGLIESDEEVGTPRALRVVGYMFTKVEEASRGK